jgi:Mg2+/Co2+ transporter CorB
MTTYIIIVIMLLLLSAFFSASETAILNASSAKIFKLKTEGNKNAAILTALQNQKEKSIGAILLGNSFANIAASSIATSITIDLLGDSGSSIVIATAVMTVLIIIYCEVLPKTYAVRHSESVALLIAPAFVGIFRVLAPILYLIHLIVDSTIRLCTFSKEKPKSIDGLELLRGTIELHHEEGHVFQEDKYMLGGIIDLDKVTVDSVMVHRQEIQGINIKDDINNIADMIISTPYSRLPVWQTKPDNILGIIHIKDILRVLQNKKLEGLQHKDLLEIIRSPWFIPSTTTLKTQLNAFRHHHSHFAFVVNEYGELLGLVTLEDIVEEVVGQIEDEHDLGHKNVVTRNSDGSVTVNGEISIRDLNREMHWKIDDEEASTVGGLLLHIAQGIPEINKSFKFDHYKFKMLTRRNQKILKVKVTHVKPNKIH